MSAEIINLTRVRKVKARADKEGRAARNRVTFGRTKEERAKAKREASLSERKIEGHRRDSADDETAR